MLAALPHLILLACIGLLCTTAGHARTWTDTLGRTLDADLVSATPTEVNVRRPDGRTLSLSRAQLSSEDLAYVAQQASASAPASLPAPSAAPQRAEKPTAPLPPSGEATTGVDFNAFNTFLGLPLLADETLWDDSPSDVAHRLKLAVEGKNAHFEGFRAYPQPGREVLGAKALMISLQAAEGRVTSILLQFANRGD
ncbi:MAG: hypothetical protein H2171_12405, partial [Opitutus sp.]|nr:hypothetical protein [Opitutus sp.]